MRLSFNVGQVNAQTSEEPEVYSFLIRHRYQAERHTTCPKLMASDALQVISQCTTAVTSSIPWLTISRCEVVPV
jgi:hypothetical protein